MISATAMTANDRTRQMTHCSVERFTVSRTRLRRPSSEAATVAMIARAPVLSRVGLARVSALTMDFSSWAVSNANQMLARENTVRPIVRATASP